MEVNLTFEAFKFMALGMGIVFSFLIVMIFTLKLQAFLIQKFFSKEVKTTKIDTIKKEKLNMAKIAAIVGVVQHHKNQGL